MEFKSSITISGNEVWSESGTVLQLVKDNTWEAINHYNLGPAVEKASSDLDPKKESLMGVVLGEMVLTTNFDIR